MKWFKAKSYGWGWTPATWQGWLITVIYLVAVIVRVWNIDPSQNNSVSDWLPHIIFYTVLLTGICYLTGEKPGWHWGGKKKR